MRFALVVLAAALLLGSGAAGYAQGSGDPSVTPPDPTLWTVLPEGNRHVASGTFCPDEVEGFASLAFAFGNIPNLLGTCAYTASAGGGTAGVRVRRYAAGEGESQEAIDNDRSLMEPDNVQGAPLFAVRMTPAATGGRLTITKTRNGYLIDCFAEGPSLEDAAAKVAAVCKN